MPFVSGPVSEPERSSSSTEGPKPLEGQPPVDPGSSPLEGAIVASQQALARIAYRLPAEAGHLPAGARELADHLRRRYRGLVDYVTCADLPARGSNRPAPESGPLFADGQVTAFGQCIGVVVTEGPFAESLAIEIARQIAAELIVYTPLGERGGAEPGSASFSDGFGGFGGWTRKPLFQGYAGPLRFWSAQRPGSDFSWTEGAGEGVTAAPREGSAVLQGVPCRVVRGGGETGAHLLVELEGEVCTASPGGRGTVDIRCTASNPDRVRSAVGSVLGLASNRISVEVEGEKRDPNGPAGGSSSLAAAAAVAALKLRRPVRIARCRETGTARLGGRAALRGDYEVAIGTGEDNPRQLGRLMGLRTGLWSGPRDAGAMAAAHVEGLPLRRDSAYFVPHFESAGDAAPSVQPRDRALRAMGVIQGLLLQEEAVEHAAHALDLRPEVVRTVNLYQKGCVTPEGGVLDDCRLDEVWRRIATLSGFHRRRDEVEEFNAAHRQVKRGLSMIPLRHRAEAGPGGLAEETYSAACTVVEIDVLTGEMTLLRVDLVHDPGAGPNPVADAGTLKRAYLEGLGYVLSEEVSLLPEHGFGARGYGAPLASTLPVEMHVEIVRGAGSGGEEGDPHGASPEGSCEPALALAVTAYFAVRHAIRAVRRMRRQVGWSFVAAPLTEERVRQACREARPEIATEVLDRRGLAAGLEAFPGYGKGKAVS